MSNLSKREKYIAIVVFVLITGYLFYTALFKPVYDEIVAKQSDIVARNADYDKIQKVKTTNVSIQKKIEDYKKAVPDKILLVPRDERNPEIEYNYDAIAKTNLMAINTVTFGKSADYLTKTEIAANLLKKPVAPVAKGTVVAKPAVVGMAEQQFKEVNVDLGVTGDSSKIFDFIKAIELDKRITQISGFKITTVKDDKAIVADKVKATISTSYFYSEGDVYEKPDYKAIIDANSGKDNLFK